MRHALVRLTLYASDARSLYTQPATYIGNICRADCLLTRGQWVVVHSQGAVKCCIEHFTCAVGWEICLSPGHCVPAVHNPHKAVQVGIVLLVHLKEKGRERSETSHQDETDCTCQYIHVCTHIHTHTHTNVHTAHSLYTYVDTDELLSFLLTPTMTRPWLDHCFKLTSQKMFLANFSNVFSITTRAPEA